MGGGLPRKWAQSFSNVPVLSDIKKSSKSEARKIGAAMVETAKRVRGYAREAAISGSGAVRQVALAKAQSAKLLAIQGAQRTGRAVVQGGGTLRRHATYYIKTNVDNATESLRMRGSVAVAQMQNAFSEYSLKLVQAATDFAVRVISKQEQKNGQTWGSNADTPISIVKTKEPKKTPEDTPCSSKSQRN